ncbi:hypothetical protein [Croceitalea sp. P059]|uniref:hypothetical protein n=1 Tax=Croceitalea sp. P059 TaxID=3075601 RepID=UPI002883953F|nr:hypothetical protein [Croceitalea sp. P059]MDT0540001.1 hypothetical protein [Croceitalea sp. P059]
MKRWIGFLGHLAIIIIFTSFGTYSFKSKSVVEVPFQLKVTSTYLSNVPSLIDFQNQEDQGSPILLGKSYVGFKEALAFKESQGKYEIVNSLGYLGKYQFGSSTLKLMGVSNAVYFLNDPVLQERIFELNVARNKWILRRDIKRFVGKRINGVIISESGMVAAAHLAGAGNVKKYLRSYGQNDFSDAYGSNIAHYMKKFANYNISKIKAQHNPKV